MHGMQAYFFRMRGKGDKNLKSFNEVPSGGRTGNAISEGSAILKFIIAQRSQRMGRTAGADIWNNTALTFTDWRKLLIASRKAAALISIDWMSCFLSSYTKDALLLDYSRAVKGLKIKCVPAHFMPARLNNIYSSTCLKSNAQSMHLAQQGCWND